MVGRGAIGEFYSKRETKIGGEALRVENLSRYGFFHSVSFTVHEGEILGVCGLAGAGRTELARSIIGETGKENISEGVLLLAANGEGEFAA